MPDKKTAQEAINSLMRRVVSSMLPEQTSDEARRINAEKLRSAVRKLAAYQTDVEDLSGTISNGLPLSKELIVALGKPRPRTKEQRISEEDSEERSRELKKNVFYSGVQPEQQYIDMESIPYNETQAGAERTKLYDAQVEKNKETAESISALRARLAKLYGTQYEF